MTGFVKSRSNLFNPKESIMWQITMKDLTWQTLDSALECNDDFWKSDPTQFLVDQYQHSLFYAVSTDDNYIWVFQSVLDLI